MSRAKKYASALASSYVALVANIAYTLASVPLALNYLSKPEFALWGLTIQIASYVALIDLGMAGISRILIDYKDRRDDPAYGGVVQTSVLVSVAQALLIVAIGVGLAFGLAPLLRVPASLEREFVFLVIGQCALLAGTFLTRIFTYLLSAHQRQDVLNYSQVLVFAANFGVLWIGFKFGWGVFSVLWSQLCGWILATITSVIWCYRLRLFPRTGLWGRPTWALFWEQFTFGRDIFLFVLGGQLINASQVIVIARELGLATAAMWVICTRTYTVVAQLVYRVFDQSCPALAEMIVRREKDWLLHRFKSLVVLSTSLAVAAGAMFAACNQTFVQLWTRGEVGWPPINDAWLAVWLVISVSARAHVGLVGQTKEFRFLRYVYLVEGLWFVILSLICVRQGGIVAMFLIGITGTLIFSFPYGTWRTSDYFGLPWRTVALQWSWPGLRLAALFVPFTYLVWWWTEPLPALLRLIVIGGITSCVGAILFFGIGLPSGLRSELIQRIASWSPLRNRWISS